MKKLLLILTIGLISFGSALSLEPINITFKASPTYSANSTISDVYITLSNKTGIVFTSQERDNVLIDDSGIITIKVGLFNATEQAAWDAITANSINSFTVLEARIGGPTVAPFTQVRIDNQIINQSSTSVFIGGNLVPQTVNSTLGTDNERFKDAYIQENSVHIGPAGGDAANTEIVFGYQDSIQGINNYGFGTVSVNANANAMRIYDTKVSLEQNSLVNVSNIDNAAGLTVNGINNSAITLAGAFTANQNANVIGNSNDATKLTITGVPTGAGDVVPVGGFELLVNGDAKVTGFLEINGLSLLGDLNMNDNDIFNVDEIRGNSVDGTLLLNTTNNTPVTIGNGNFTVGNGVTSIGTGAFNKTGAGVSTFAGNVVMNEDVTLGSGIADGDLTTFNSLVASAIIPNGGNTYDLGTGANTWKTLYLGTDANIGNNANVTNNLTVNGNTTIGDADTDNINVIGEFVSSLVPNADNQYNLGSDLQRWKSLYLDATSLHLGDAGGSAGNDELHVTYNGTNTANFAVNGANPQFAINSAGNINLDPNANLDVNYAFTATELTVNTFTGTDLGITEDGVYKNLATDETFAFSNNLAGNLNVTMDGDLNVAEQVTAPNSGHTFGTLTNDATVVTINGDIAGAAYELIVDGDADILGDAHIDQTLVVVGTSNLQGNVDADADLNVNGNTILGTTSANTVVFNADIASNMLPSANDTYSLGSVAGDKWRNINLSNNANIGNDANITNDANVGADLDVVGNTTLNGNTTLGDDLATDITTFASKVNSSIIPNGAANAFTLGTDTERWADAFIGGNSVHVGPTGGLGASTELKIGYDDNIASFNVDGTTNSQLNINTISKLIDLDPAGDGTTINYSFGEGQLEIDNGVGTTNVVITEGGISRNNDAADETFTFSNPGLPFDLDVVVSGDVQVDKTLTVDGTSLLIGNVDANSGVDVTGAALTVGTPTLFSVDGTTGVLTSTTSGNSIGATSAATQLTINGIINDGTYDFKVVGDADIDGLLNVDGNAEIDGTLDVDGNTTLLSNTTFGDNVADQIVFNARIASNVLPITNNGFDLGSSTQQWKDLYVGNNATIGNQARFTVTGGGTETVGFRAPAAAATSTLYTLPAAAPTANGQALIGTTAGVLSWGGVSLQSAYVAGNEITTSAGEGKVVIKGDQSLDVQVDIENTAVASPVTINDPQGLNVIGGVIQGNNGLAITSGTATLSGGLSITGGNVTMSSTGTFDIQSTVTQTTVSSPLTASKKVTLGSTGATNNVVLDGVVSQTIGGSISSYANVIIIANTGTSAFTSTNLSPNFADGSVVFVRSLAGTASTFTDDGAASTSLNTGQGMTIAKFNGSWYIIGEFN